MGTDRDWEAFGANNPYFGVLTDARYDAANLDEDAKERFFRTGESHIERVFEELRRLFGDDLKPRRAIDFGCGVGRLSIPLAQRCEQVTGIDVSPSMLREAEANCARRGIENVRFVSSDDGLSRIAGQRFDFVFSNIVFQHIPVARGKRIYQGLLERLEPGGIAALGFTYAKEGRPLDALRGAVKRIPFARRTYQVVVGASYGVPAMEMNPYPLDWLVKQAQLRGAERVHMELSKHEHTLAAMLIFRVG